MVHGDFLCVLISKVLFIIITSLESYYVRVLLEKKANESRQQFLRYVFHEVRVPLNTITMGLAVMKSETDCMQNEAMCEVITMMNSGVR
jgi:signal transduction histidine kinase